MTLRIRLPIAVTVIAVIVAVVLFTDSAFSQTGGTGGTGPVEPTPTAVPTVTPTPVPPEIKNLIALGQITVKLAAIQDRLGAIELGIAVLSFTPTPGPTPLQGQTVIEICNQCEVGAP